MKKVLLSLAILGFVGAAYGEETMGEKTKATAKDVKRTMKKGAHRTQEALCAKGDAKCLAEKAKHRGEEAADATKDAGSEIKNKVDSDSN